MKKIKLLAICTACLIIMSIVFVACDKKKYAIDRLDNFVERVEKHAPNYTAEDWEKADEKFEAIITEIGKYEYSGEEAKQIGALEGKYLGIRTKGSVKNMMEDLDIAAECVFRRYPFTNSGDIRSLGWQSSVSSAKLVFLS